MTAAALAEDDKILEALTLKIEDLRALLSHAPCWLCQQRLGLDPLDPPVLFEGELAHELCAEVVSLASVYPAPLGRRIREASEEELWLGLEGRLPP